MTFYDVFLEFSLITESSPVQLLLNSNPLRYFTYLACLVSLSVSAFSLEKETLDLQTTMAAKF